MRELGALIGVTYLALIVPAVLGLVATWTIAPFAIVSVARNIAKTRRAIERLADGVPSGRGPGPGGVLGI